MDKSLNHAIVEVTPRSIDVRYDNICTNHFEILTHENRNYTKESKKDWRVPFHKLMII